MKKSIGIAALFFGSLLGSTAYAATGLDTYVDKNGFIDVQALTCAQLADTYRKTLTHSLTGTLVGTMVQLKNTIIT